MFLEPKELHNLTGFKYAAKQIRWLQENGYIYEVGGDGKPKVLRSYVVTRMGGVVEPQSPGPKLHLQ